MLGNQKSSVTDKIRDVVPGVESKQSHKTRNTLGVLVLLLIISVIISIIASKRVEEGLN